MAAASGFLNVRKPQGVTSHRCVLMVRQLFGTRRVGHGGTLDPMATGVLTMALGNATKFLQASAAQYLTSDKEYNGVIRFGVTTDTDDITGNVLRKHEVPWLTERQVRDALQRYVGTIDQVPPRVSAIKKDGKRMYELARTNQLQQADVKARRVHISSIELRKFTPGLFPEAKIHVACAAGTYIRSIARECGEALATPTPTDSADAPPCVGGTLAALERSRSGIFGLDTSVDFDELRRLLQAGENPLEPIENALTHLPFVQLPPEAAHMWQIGGVSWARPADFMSGGDRADAREGPCAVANGETVRVFRAGATPEFLGVSQVERPHWSDDFVLRTRAFA
ncbi:hypothetical protein PybrP1_007091 [[Pythium] brassicae (nom. inval.)]|nr:hypothetical protein PybrP1_007091 [[Pythium] brassicae (nom. inval.)]